MKGCDHSNGGVIIGAGLKAKGYYGIFRYAAAGRSDVNVNAAEVRDLRAHGIEIAIVNEHSSAYLLGGYQTGYDRALSARVVCRNAGLPDGVIYMGGDNESLQASSSNLALVASAIRGAGDAVGRENVGYYGSYWVINSLVRNVPWLQWYWQTVAWSNGLRHPRAVALQHASTDYVGGVQLDINDIWVPNFGQRFHAPPTPPTEAVMATAAAQLQGVPHVFAITDVGCYYTFQPGAADPGVQHDWEGGATDKQIAGLKLFAKLPEKCKSISAAEFQGVPHVIVEGDSGRLYYTYQSHGQSGWNGGKEGVSPAGFVPFAPAP